MREPSRSTGRGPLLEGICSARHIARWFGIAATAATE
jgi:hypothetical protein